MKKLMFLIALTVLLNIPLLNAQMHNGNFGNEWINYNQSYFKFQLTTDGLHRIDASALQTSGININSIPVNNFQIFNMGREIPIYVGSTNGLVDYIEFYGEKQRGELDNNLYNNETQHFNPQKAIISDTSAYFLTWNNSGNGLRYSNSASNLNNLPVKENYYLHKSLTVIDNIWQRGKDYPVSGINLQKSSFDFGEGWGSNKSTNQSFNVPISNVYSSGPAANCSIRMYSANSINHNIQVNFANSSVYTNILNNESVNTHTFPVPLNMLTSNTTVNVRGNSGTIDQHSVSFIEIIYPRSFNFGGSSYYKFSVPAGSRKFLEITNFNGTGAAAGQTIYLYDLTNQIRIQCFWDGAKVLTDLPPSTSDRDLILINYAISSNIISIGRLDPVNFTDYSNVNGDYIILYNALLQTNSQGSNPIIDYAAYRASTGFNPVMIDIQQVFDQFGYGYNMHPVSIRNLAAYLKQVWTNPEYIFLIGKGRIYTEVRNFNTFDHLIPTFGTPPSDNIMVAALGSDVPIIPIGRLAATTGDQVSLYLQKIRDVEAQKNSPSTLLDRGWMKNVVHLGGGRTSTEQASIRQYLDVMANNISGRSYGANVHSFFKTSSNPIQAAQSAFLDSLINNGVSLITFFGHSSANSFDFNLDRPENYSNYRKYPLVLSLGCYGGSIFESSQYVSEKFIFEPEAGASVFLASVGPSSTTALNTIATAFYNEITGLNYRKGAAKAFRDAAFQLERSTSYSLLVELAFHYMSYHGDPAVNLNSNERPDYYSDLNLVSHEPNPVTIQMNNFELKLDLFNLGKAIDTVFYIDVNRTLPDGQTVFVGRQRISAPYFQKEVTFSVLVGGREALGVNYFDVSIDVLNEISETPNPAAEQNNLIVRYPVQILSESILPVFPYEFSIVNNSNITLKAATGNVLAAPQNYRLQIDTTELYNSPIMRETSVNHPGGLVEWTPNLNYQDSVVYYWRVSVDSVSPTSGYTWSGSSFIYLNGSFPGWNQSHFFQYKKDKFTNIELPETRTFNFINSFQEITVKNGFSPSPLNPEDLAVFVNGSKIDKCRCFSNRGTYVTVIDSANLDIWTMPGFSTRFGAINCDPSGRIAYSFLFETDQPAKQLAMENFLRDSIPDGFFVLIHTLNDADADRWPTSLISYFQSQGSTQIGNLAAVSSGLPWAFFYRKNTSFSNRNEAIGSSINDIIDMSGLIPGRWSSGDLNSTIIGPALNWNSFHWRTNSQDTFQTDEVIINIYGLDSMQFNRTLLFENLTVIDTSLLSINASSYPFLQLEWKTKDEVNLTSSQLYYWRVLADMAPEATLRPDIFKLVQFDTVQQGLDFRFEILMENISTVDMDSMLIKYSLSGGQAQYKRIAALGAGDTLYSTPLIFDTRSLNGQQYLTVEINPDNDQRELYHFNNIAVIPFYVMGDIINPLLDVTFDGNHIMNGDLVSAKPQIIITLTDENKFLGLDELSDFKIILRHPSFNNGETELNLSSPLVKSLVFIPADPSNLQIKNKAQINIDLDLPLDGNYTLFVSATDKSGNNSGSLDYNVDFEVINESSISNVLNYPNPFTTQTQFVFTLTGRELPEEMKIQIYTISGKIVKEISLEELGPINIGVNRSQYHWDGTDQFGDRLANGAYLYKVITKMKKEDSSELKHYNTKASSLFNNGFGKLYLMR